MPIEVTASSPTPGPWRVETVGNVYITSADGDVAIARGRTDDIKLANARLLSSAPDLKRVLTACYHALESYAHGNGSPTLAAECAAAAIDVLKRVDGRS